MARGGQPEDFCLASHTGNPPGRLCKLLSKDAELLDEIGIKTSGQYSAKVSGKCDELVREDACSGGFCVKKITWIQVSSFASIFQQHMFRFHQNLSAATRARERITAWYAMVMLCNAEDMRDENFSYGSIIYQQTSVI
ncbi:hypothetical protein E2C01_020877 [Portunus trituberculatus]|uniref:Uncharacterized protein n=1 Tax=Portunus trituberculatus TaxID=210409 RepID=A0A5B7E1R8_PORTR|nr:hypothetical protein [Portunus trituberculatus]